MATAAPAPTSIPAPADFPVDWAAPGDERRLWQREGMHFAGQSTALDFDFVLRAVQHGFNFAAEAYNLPVRNRYGRFNTYVYQSIAPVSFDPEALAELGQRAEQALGAAFAGQRARWDGESLPELLRMFEVWEAFDLEGAPLAALVEHLERSLESAARAWEIHFLTVFPAALSSSVFDDTYRDLFGGGTFDSWRLLQGLDNLSLRADRAIHELVVRARRSPELLDALRRGAVDEVRGPLGLDEYLERWGKRLGLYATLSSPSYVDDPRPVLTTVLDALEQGERDLEAELAGLAEEREQAVAAARAELESYPAGVREQFEFLLASAQEAMVVLEDHNFSIDQRVSYEVQRVAQAVGARLAAAGLLDHPADVFHLHVEELRAGGDLRGPVAERKAELARFAGVAQPPALGSLPPGPPPQDPISRAIAKVFGDLPEEATEPGLVHGMAGSPGVVRGVARVLRSLAEADRLGAGEVLVTETTAPPWSPLFARAAAIVTDAGGILSHCAVVAREYMIPAVVGTLRGTQAIRDGQLVEVDGSAGTVRVVEE